jgi:hypothetical protein
MRPDIPAGTKTFDMTALGARSSPGKPDLRLAVVIRADIGPAVEFTTTEGNRRAMFPILGGVALGLGWEATILPGGGDFALGLPDGSYAIEARYMLQMSDGTPVMVHNAGRMMARPDGSFEGRTRATLEVPAGPHSALGAVVWFGTARAEAGDDDHVFIELWAAELPSP